MTTADSVDITTKPLSEEDPSSLQTTDINSSPTDATVVEEEPDIEDTPTIAMATEPLDQATSEVNEVEEVDVVQEGGAESDDEEKRALLAEENILVLEEAEKVSDILIVS